MLLLRDFGVARRLLLVVALCVPSSAAAQSADRIRGVVTTRSGVAHEGFLRFESGAGAWTDRLVGRSASDAAWEDRVMESMGAELDARGRSVEFLGVRISWDDDRGASGAPRTSVAVGDLVRLQATGDGDVEAEVRGGEVVLFREGFGWVEVERGSAGLVRVEESDIDAIHFTEPSDGLRARGRLHAVVEDRWGRSWRGPLTWTRGQSLLGDSLLGTDPEGVTRVVPFDDLRVVEPRFGGAARVTTAGGRVLELDRSADLERSGRGVQVYDPEQGLATIPWVDLRRVTLVGPDAAPGPAFGESRVGAGGRGALRGTVRTRDGRTLVGRVHWGDGTRSRWGDLSGYSRSVFLDVPIPLVERVERYTSQGARLHLIGGGVVEVRGGDFNSARGPIVVDDGSGALQVVEWRAVDWVTFVMPDGSGGDVE